ncbi:hypothetical protein BST36_10220 [Mycolicibacterium moriokaense]|uniref:Uncharacterized protein n=1 Tax=Mycolicibacterium moriokaense TaxID=39691 RepID=A0AAD1M7I0_9MYCO|nr:hypothetical protein [Mycolicibacterium moriokaense]MCV7038398.1 hypothetical protein [Mycolicibacterium moriokaense]ORB24926.1 hypothetical protein BST36_10220 [Mycolicibacterium moriokaense]BBX02479.1 hypothetical protein MMOR_34150 [Mycolicibacterium moriokaense]
MSVIAAACAGFLVAVLWMDLIFDSQVLRHRGVEELPESVLASIAGYYRRATTTSRPMSYLIAFVMAILLGTLGFAWVDGPIAVWPLAVTSGLAGGPILLAVLHTVPNAVRLGARTGDLAKQSRLARSICRDHVICLACMVGFLAVWLTIPT